MDIFAEFYGNFKWNCSKNVIRNFYKRKKVENCKDGHYKTGHVTEYLARYNVNRYLQEEKGLKHIRSGIEPNSYLIRYHYGKKKTKGKVREGHYGKGCDIWVRHFDENSNPKDYWIEVNGWRKMTFGISSDIFDKRWGKRFKKYDPENKDTHIVMITKPNVGEIAERCKEQGIKLVSIPIQPTKSYLNFLRANRRKNTKCTFLYANSRGQSTGEN